MTRRITDCVAAQARHSPNVTAVIDVRESTVCVWTWSKLWREAEHTAGLLLRLGVQPGEIVTYQLPNRAEFVAITLGILRIGAVCCPLVPFFREHELLSALTRSRARVLFIADEFRGRHCPAEIAALEPKLDNLEHIVVIKTGELKSSSLPRTAHFTWARFYRAVRAAAPDHAAIEARRPAADSIAQLLFTSGTSGVSKGILHRHSVLMAAASMHAERLEIDGADRIFVPSPLAHQTGFLYGMWVALAVGIPQIIQGVWDPERALRMLREWRGTFLQAAPTFLSDLLQAALSGVRAPSSLRLVVPTGATVATALAARVAQTLHTRVCGAFGTTEGCLATLSAPADPPEKASASDGRALPEVQLRICNDAGEPLPPGQEGHFQTYSPTMFAGYLDDPSLTGSAYTEDGWYRTGDLAILDTEGYLHVTGRIHDIINRGDEKIPVVEVEQLLYQHSAVKEVAIVAMPDVRLGERACAFVVLRPGMAFDFEMMQRLLDEQRVARQFWPEHLEIVPELPKTSSGKIQKYLLRERTMALAVARAGATP